MCFQARVLLPAAVAAASNSLFDMSTTEGTASCRPFSVGTQEAVAKLDRDGVPLPSAAGDGTPALPKCRDFTPASFILSLKNFEWPFSSQEKTLSYLLRKYITWFLFLVWVRRMSISGLHVIKKKVLKKSVIVRHWAHICKCLNLLLEPKRDFQRFGFGHLRGIDSIHETEEPERDFVAKTSLDVIVRNE